MSPLIMKKLFYRILGLDNDFERIFFTNEYKVLAGKKNRTILSLLSILFLTFIAIGFAVGGVQKLRKNMDNPFTNWVELIVSNNSISDKSAKMIERYSSPEASEKYMLDRSNGFCEFVLHIYQANFEISMSYRDTLNRTVWGRTIEPDESLFQKILEKDNLIWKARDFDPANNGFEADEIVVTDELMKQLKFGEVDSTFGNVLIYIDTNLVCLKIKAVVNRLPGISRFISSPALYNVATAKNDGGNACGELVKANNENSNELSFLLKNDKYQSMPFDSVCREFFSGKSFDKPASSDILIGGNRYVVKKLYFYPTEKPDSASLLNLKKLIDSMFVSSAYASIDTENDRCRAINYRDYHNLAFNFKRLNRVREFSKDIEREFNIEIEMDQVEEKENFDIVSSLTVFTSVILLLFGISSVVLFITNLLKSHLGAIRANLGTLQAFGLSNKFIERIYLKIIFTFLILSVGLASLLALVIDAAEGFLMKDESLFSFVNFWIFIAIAGLMSVSLWFSSVTIHRLMDDTPGNLIYER
jgi:hypothetical protein